MTAVVLVHEYLGSSQADDKECPHQTLAWQLSLSTVLNLNLHPTSLID